MDRNDINEFFTYHAPTEGQIPRYNRIREAAKEFAQTIMDCVPNSPDRTAAIRLLRESVMTANAGIALEGHWQTKLGGNAG